MRFTVLGYFHAPLADPTLQALTLATLISAEGWASYGPAGDIARAKALLALGAEAPATALLQSSAAPEAPSLRAELALLHGDKTLACQPREKGGDAPLLALICQAWSAPPPATMLLASLAALQAEQPTLVTPLLHQAIKRLIDKTTPLTLFPAHCSLLEAAIVLRAAAAPQVMDHIETLPPLALTVLLTREPSATPLHQRAFARARQIGLLPDAPLPLLPEPPFSKALAGDVTSLVASLQAGQPSNAADEDVMKRLKVEGAPVQDARRLLRLLAVMEPFGARVPPSVLKSLLLVKTRHDGEMPPSLLLTRLHAAARAKHPQEVVLWAALVLGSLPASQVPEIALVPVLQALQEAGFALEARKIAYDAVARYQ